MIHQTAIYLTALILTVSLMVSGCGEIKNMSVKFMEKTQQHSDGGG